MNRKKTKTKMKAARMIALREARGLSQEELAELSGLSKNQIWRIETERSVPSVDTAMRIAHALECSLDYLLGASGRADFLTTEEMRLIDAFRLMKLTADERRWLMAFRKNDPTLIADLLAVFMARLSEQLKDRGDVSDTKDSSH